MKTAQFVICLAVKKVATVFILRKNRCLKDFPMYLFTIID